MSVGPLRRIVVGVDESPSSADALRWASQEAALHDAELTAVLAWEHTHQHHEVVADRTGRPPGGLDPADALQAYIGSALGEGRAATVRTVVQDGLAVRALLGATADADLLVVGARRVGGLRRLLLGSVSQHCLHHTTIPIAIISTGSEAIGRHERIVVGVDGSGPSERALRWAIQEARARRTRLEVVTTRNVLRTGAAVGTPWAVAQEPGHDEGAQQLVRSLASEDLDGVDVRPVVLHRPAAEGLVDHAADADLLVVGSRGHGVARRAALGSVASQVTQHAACPVVVVPADGAPTS